MFCHTLYAHNSVQSVKRDYKAEIAEKVEEEEKHDDHPNTVYLLKDQVNAFVCVER